MSQRARTKVIEAMAKDIEHNIRGGLGPIKAIKSGIVIGTAMVQMLADIANELEYGNYLYNGGRGK